MTTASIFMNQDEGKNYTEHVLSRQSSVNFVHVSWLAVKVVSLQCVARRE